MRLSVSMIVKNESSCLVKCLESVKDADEIVIVDTGSDDDTVEIAKRYTDKVFSGEEFLWRDDFAFSRNQSLERCTGDWVLIVDADEVLEDGGIEKLREAIENTTKKALSFETICAKSGEMHRSIRAFKNGEGSHWKGRIHNYLSIVESQTVPIKITYGYSEAHKKDPDRALRILTKVLEENPKAVRETYYLAREYWYRKDYETAAHWYKDYLTRATWAPEMADAWLMLARCLWNLHRGEEARLCCLRAIQINANFKEALLFMSEISGPKNKVCWSRYAELATNEDVLFVRV